MEKVYDIAMIVLPSLIVFLTAFYTIKGFLENEQKKRLLELRKDGQKLLTPIRLQAYERAAMFLERISPDTLITRVHKNGMSARKLQSELLKSIRDEFNHNLSQQIYMSDQAWFRVKSAKEEMIKLFNLASSRLNDDATGIDLSKIILQLTLNIEKLPTQSALEYIKKEIRQSF
ncbi:MAG: hypothetical protein ABII90_15980 [Bacteroidota bacterium]